MNTMEVITNALDQLHREIDALDHAKKSIETLSPGVTLRPDDPVYKAIMALAEAIALRERQIIEARYALEQLRHED